MKKLFLLGFIFILLCSFTYSLGCEGNTCVNYIDNNGDLTRWYRLNQTTTTDDDEIIDEVGNLNLVIQNDVPLTSLVGTIIDYSGLINGGYSFERGANNLNNFKSPVGSDSTTVSFSGDFTINYWANLTETTNEAMFITCSNSDGLLVWTVKTQNDKFSFNKGAGFIDSSDISSYVDGEWHMFTIKRNSTNTYLMIDRVILGSGNAGNTATACRVNINGQITGGVNFNNLFEASVSDYSLWNRGLNTTDLNCLYDGSSCNQPILIDNFKITAKTFYFNDTINIFNATINGVTYYTTNGTLTTPFYQNETSLYDIILEAPNHEITTYTDYNMSIDLNAYLDYNFYKINITAIDILENTSISDFTININSLEYTTTNGTLIIEILKEEYIIILIDSLGYALSNETIYSNDWEQNLEFSLYPTNSISIEIKDESTNLLITENVSIKFSSIFGDVTNQTNTGLYFTEGLEPGVYDLSFSSENYQLRIYTITINNRSHQNLNVYLTKSTDTTIFTIKDKDTANLLEGVQVSMYRTINGSWEPVEVRNSDITGRVQFTYTKDTYYKFYLSVSNYEELIFYLNPILFSTYDIGLQSLVSDNSSPDYNDITLIFTESFASGENTFNFLIQSATGVLIDYDYNLTYPESFNTNYGSNSIGEQLTTNFNITNAGSFDRIELNYFYESTTSGGRRYFKNYFPITISEYNNTMMSNNDQTYGLGLFERILVITIIGILILGIASLIGKPIPGLILLLLVWGWFVYVGFIEWWLIAISFVVGLLILGRRNT